MKILFKAGVLAFTFSMLLFGCNNAPDEESVVNEQEDKKENTVSLTSEQYKRAGIETGNLLTRKLASSVDARGMIAVKPEGQAFVSTLNEGIIETIFVEYGEIVNVGTPLCRISHPSIIQAQQGYLEDLYEFRLAEDNYERSKELRKENITSEKAFLKSESEFMLARSSKQASYTQLEMIGIDPQKVEKGEISDFVDLKSPISGKINKINASPGTYVGINEKLFDIVALDKMILELKVFESDIPLIRKGQEVIFTLSNLNDIPHRAEVVATSSIMERGSRVLEVQASLLEKLPDVYPGMFAAASVKVNEKEALSLPNSAVLEEGENEHYLFILLDENENSSTFQRISVTTGIQTDNYTEILPGSGLTEGTKIVVSGVYYLKSELLKELD